VHGALACARCASQRLGDILADFLALRATAGAGAVEQPAAVDAVGLVRTMVGLCDGLADDAVFARQVRERARFSPHKLCGLF
jgi:hypothetical protein